MEDDCRDTVARVADLVLPAVSDDSADLVYRLQTAPAGNRTLDAQIQSALLPNPPDQAVTEPPIRWSEDLTALLRLVPDDHNFTLGERDGVLWTWIQPNDGWSPADTEMRHDHPRGSGLIVACTLPLAMAAALVALRCGRRHPDEGAEPPLSS
jgi:hypothetical protein